MVLRATAVPFVALAVACGGGNSAARPDCPVGQTSLDGTCVSQQIADYVGCIRATGATVASDSAKSLSAAAGVAGVTGSTQAEVKDKLEKSYAKVSDENAQTIIRNCDTKTAATGTASAPSAATTVVSNSAPTGAVDYSGDWITDYDSGDGKTNIHAGLRLVETGRSVSGTYSGTGSVQGTLDGQVLAGTWSNVCGGGKCGGKLRFIFGADGRSFSGQWGMGDDVLMWRWTGTRP